MLVRTGILQGEISLLSQDLSKLLEASLRPKPNPKRLDKRPQKRHLLPVELALRLGSEFSALSQMVELRTCKIRRWIT